MKRERKKATHTHTKWIADAGLKFSLTFVLCCKSTASIIIINSYNVLIMVENPTERASFSHAHSLTTQTHFLVYFPNFSFISHTSSFVKCVMCMCIEFCLCMYEWMGMAGMDRTLVHAPRSIQQLFIVNINNRDNFASLAKSR